MSFTIEQLEAACQKFETDYFQGKPCTGVRNMLANMIQGGVTPKRKPTVQRPSKHDSKRLRLDAINTRPTTMENIKTRLSSKRRQPDSRDNPTRKKPKASSQTPTSASPVESNDTSASPMSSINKTKSSNQMKGEKRLGTRFEQNPNLAYAALIAEINDPRKNQDIFYRRLQFQCDMLKQLGLVRVSDRVPSGRKYNYEGVTDPKIEEIEGGQTLYSVRGPLAHGLLFQLAWYMVVEDYCEALVINQDVNFSLQGGMTLEPA